MQDHRPDVTRLLRRWSGGDGEALEELTPLVYGELHRLAHRLMLEERQGHLLQTTALVHEAYLRLVRAELDLESRGHFYRVAARQMRRVLVDAARRRQAAKRGGGQELSLEGIQVADEPRFEILALDDALARLGEFDERKAQLVELRFFGGLAVREAAEVMGVSLGTVERDLRLAKAWLRRALHDTGSTV